MRNSWREGKRKGEEVSKRASQEEREIRRRGGGKEGVSR